MTPKIEGWMAECMAVELVAIVQQLAKVPEVLTVGDLTQLRKLCERAKTALSECPVTKPLEELLDSLLVKKVKFREFI